MKIAIFSDTFSPQINGVARVAHQSAEILAKLGHQVMVLTAAARTNKEKLTSNNGFSVAFCPSLPVGVYPGERAALPFGFSAFSKIKKFGPEIIHSHTPFAIGWGSVFASKISGIKLIGTHHTFYDHYLKYIKMDYRWAKWLTWKYTVRYYNFCDLVISPSKSLADELVNRGLYKPIRIIANAIDTNFFKPATPEIKKRLKKKFGIADCSLIYMGRLSYEKNIDQALRAFSLAAKENSRISFMIVGDGPEKINLENFASDLGIRNKVIFTGFLRDGKLLETLQASDIFITASKSENMPLSVLEAMATGLPIVAVAEKGMPEIVKNGINGFLAGADDWRTMSEHILQICSDKKLREKFSSASHVLAADHSPANIGGLLEKTYQEVLNGKIT